MLQEKEKVKQGRAMGRAVLGGGALLNKVLKIVLRQEEIFEHRLEGGDKVSHAEIWNEEVTRFPLQSFWDNFRKQQWNEDSRSWKHLDILLFSW